MSLSAAWVCSPSSATEKDIIGSRVPDTGMRRTRELSTQRATVPVFPFTSEWTRAVAWSCVDPWIRITQKRGRVQFLRVYGRTDCLASFPYQKLGGLGFV